MSINIELIEEGFKKHFLLRKSGSDKSSYDFFLPAYSLVTLKSAHTSERVRVTGTPLVPTK